MVMGHKLLSHPFTTHSSATLVNTPLSYLVQGLVYAGTHNCPFTPYMPLTHLFCGLHNHRIVF